MRDRQRCNSSPMSIADLPQKLSGLTIVAAGINTYDSQDGLSREAVEFR